MPRSLTRHPLLALAALAAGLYLLAVIGVSLASRERVLGPGTPKHFCGFYLDCHRMVALEGVEVRQTLGELRPTGRFYVVTLRFASDAKRAVMHTGRLSAVVRGDDGRRLTRVEPAERALAMDPGADVGLPDRPIAPGQHFLTRIVFDIPSTVTAPRLYVRDTDRYALLTELFLLGDEDSVLHARTTFTLATPRATARRHAG
ncbi:MAG: hypothetical protein OER21_13725 [Gemmatimonadota bacterium]|nr:hypothetical protein [Gemmatimonadota bacterium]